MVLHGRSALRVVFFSLFFALSIQEGASANSPDVAPGVCERSQGRGTLDGVVADPSARMGFYNTGGIGNGGVCWWHSRFQRAAWTLAEFRPDLPKPTREEAVRLINTIARLSRVVVIPGYASFFRFSADFRDEIQRELNQWQIRDGFINQAWIRGISGQYDMSNRPGRLVKIMDRLFQYAEMGKRQNFIPWVMLQLKGIEAHAALVTDMQKTEDGYSINIIESNYPEKTFKWKFRNGDGHLGNTSYVTIPYYGIHRDVVKMKAAVGSYCRTATGVVTSSETSEFDQALLDFSAIEPAE